MGAAAHRTVTQSGGDAVVHALLARAALAQRLAACFRYPGAGSAAALRTAFAGFLGSTPRDPELVSAVSRLAAAVDGLGDGDLQAAYSRLFIGVSAGSPHETAYGPRRLTTAAELADVQGFYRAFGFDLSRAVPDMADHVGAELEFHAALLVKLAWATHQELHEAREITTAAAAAFLEAHLGRWIPAFAHRLASSAPDTVYARAAAEAERFVAAECERFGVAPTAVSPAGPGDEAEAFTCPRAERCG